MHLAPFPRCPAAAGFDGAEHEYAVVFDSLGSELGMADGDATEGFYGIDVELFLYIYTYFSTHVAFGWFAFFYLV